MANLAELNGWPRERAIEELMRCCGSKRWAAGVAEGRPYRDEGALMAAADRVWAGLSAADWREAFAHHPMIGGKDALRAKFAATRTWAQGEQGGVAGADEAVLDGLAEGNAQYADKFGFIFITCATGKSASQMLVELRQRLAHEAEREIGFAAAEQAKITKLRLEKLLK